MKNLKNLQKELRKLEKELERLVDYQSDFEYNERTTEEWNTLQETIRELCVAQSKLQKQITDLQK